MLGAMFGTTEILVIAGVVVLIFGANKLPQLGDGLGKAIRGFQKAVTGGDEKSKLKEAEAAAPADADQK
jgi:sec-independent protein translocase protein TatA